MKIGYPDRWRDYSGLEVHRGDLLGNARRAMAFNHEYQLNKLGGPVNRDEWLLSPQVVNAYYNPSLNEIVFPAAILQPPFFDPQADPAVNYGAIGGVIGHEIGHGFDDQGRKMDGDGILRDWWSAEDAERFQEKSDRLVEMYDEFCPLEGMCVNGQLTLGENIGDVGGLEIAYHAYRLSLDGREPPVLEGITGDQRFFLGWAQIWRGKYRDEFIANILSSDPHSPVEFRVNGALRNIDAFYAAWDVEPGDEMYPAAGGARPDLVAEPAGRPDGIGERGGGRAFAPFCCRPLSAPRRTLTVGPPDPATLRKERVPMLRFRCAPLVVLLSFLAVPALAETAEKILRDAMARHDERLEGIRDYTIVQSAMGFDVTTEYVVAEIDGHRVPQSKGAMEHGGDDAGMIYTHFDRMAAARQAGRQGRRRRRGVLEDRDRGPAGSRHRAGGGRRGDGDESGEGNVLDRPRRPSAPPLPRGRNHDHGKAARTPSPSTCGCRDYRTVDGLTYPFRTTMSMTGAQAGMSAEDVAEAKRSLAEMKAKMAEMPAEQRKMMEQMMGGQLEQLEKMVGGEAMSTELVVKEVKVNTGG